MKKREEVKAAKRQNILCAAKEEFLTFGYVSASMDNIARHANVTKQTIYRYFGSKIDLFQETLRFIGTNSKSDYLRHLHHPDAEEALYTFAREFVSWHLSERHLAVYRLLIAERSKAPRMIEAFFAVGPEITQTHLTHFFEERLGVIDAGALTQMCIGMLLVFRNAALLGNAKSTDQEIDEYVKEVTHLLLNAAPGGAPDSQ